MTAASIRAASFTNNRQLSSCYIRGNDSRDKMTVDSHGSCYLVSALGCQLSSYDSIPLSQLSTDCSQNQSQWQQLQNIRYQSLASPVGAVKYQLLVSALTFMMLNINYWYHYQVSADHTHSSWLEEYHSLSDWSQLREAIKAKKSQNCGLFPYGGGGSTPFHSFWGCFP